VLQPSPFPGGLTSSCLVAYLAAIVCGAVHMHLPTLMLSSCLGIQRTAVPSNLLLFSFSKGFGVSTGAKISTTATALLFVLASWLIKVV